MITLTHLDIAHRFLGQKERPGQTDNPFIVACLALVGLPDSHDEVPWCSGMFALIVFLSLGFVPKRVTAAARSWLIAMGGLAITLEEASTQHLDAVILKRGDGPQPGPDVIAAQGHVGLFYGLDGDNVRVLGGNQNNAVTVASFPRSRVLGVRRFA